MTVFQPFWARGVTLNDADNALDGVTEGADSRPQGLLGCSSETALPRHQNDMGYLSHRVRLDHAVVERLARRALLVHQDLGERFAGEARALRRRRPDARA